MRGEVFLPVRIIGIRESTGNDRLWIACEECFLPSRIGSDLRNPSRIDAPEVVEIFAVTFLDFLFPSS